jgi:inorganic pyrophosphatase
MHTHAHIYTNNLSAYPSLQVKAVGTLAMIDEGELDWKVIGVSMSDPKAASINSVADLEKAFPGQIDAVSQVFL